MKFLLSLLLVFILASIVKAQTNSLYISNQYPLKPTPYTALPLGSIKPHGWLKKMLELQRDGLTGNLDSVYSEVCGPTNAWLGGDGDAWERGPYWLDGLVPLAYILDDKKLKQKIKPWIEWSINTQRADGYFGPQPPLKPLPEIPGVQNSLHEDWWPKMVMLKVLQQYYSATNDKRVITLMSRYFKYMLQQLPQKPLGHWTFWGEQRGGDNLQVVYWLYNITKEPFLLELGDLIYKQSTPWKEYYLDNTFARQNPYANLHCVNIAQGFKSPVIQFQRSGDSSNLTALKAGLKVIRDVHGFANGMYGGDEPLHGNNPTQGSELCSVTEMMFSFEGALSITGDVYYADYLEKIAFNVLPTQHNDDFTLRQYFQQPNQIKISHAKRNFIENDGGRLVMGLLNGYPCCTANMHQGYPKFVQNLWYATADNGLAALLYSASNVSAKVANSKTVTFEETTNYPFDDKIHFTYKGESNINFPLHLRIPAWCKNAFIKVNGQPLNAALVAGQIFRLNRTWKANDKIELVVPMDIQYSNWVENSIAIERGPLLYALRLEAEEVKKLEKDGKRFYYEYFTKASWNYGILQEAIEKKNFTVTVQPQVAAMPWNLANVPISITTIGKQVPEWQEYNDSAGPLPRTGPNNGYGYILSYIKPEKITLVPYGCTQLRISQFPVVN
jgi:uncharacterized protein